MGLITAEARRTRRKEFLLRKYSGLCELGVSAVNRIWISHHGGAEYAEKRILD
jgi:hypothetical protein